MAKWRKMAIEYFEDLKGNFADKDYSIYMLFGDLRYKLSACLKENNKAEIGKIFDFTKWCAKQEAEDLWNAAGVSFYEHLFDNKEHVDTIVSYLSKDDVKSYMALWEHFTDPTVLKELKQKLKRNGKL